MRRFLIIFIATFASLFCFADTGTFKTFSDGTKKYQIVKTFDVEGVTISQGCKVKGKMSCEAWSAVINKRAPASSSGVLGNPAAKYCGEYNAFNRIFLDAKGREFDFCVFKDNSSIDAWSLYYKHHGSR